MGLSINGTKSVYKMGENRYNMDMQITKKHTNTEAAMGLVVKEGNYLTLGAIVAKNQVTFTFECEKEDVCRIVLISKLTQQKEIVPVPKEYCLGALRSITITGFNPQDYNYIYEINDTEYLDPYANRIVGREIWNDESREADKYSLKAGFATDTFSWGEDKNPEICKSQMIMYKLHVRGFSMANKSAGKTRGTFMAVKNKIPYLKDLGITTVELMPVYEFEELPLVQELPQVPDYVKWEAEKNDIIQPIVLEKQKKRLNYWGYGEGNYFAVKSSYASEPQKAAVEFKKLIKTLHENSMECVMEIFFPEGTSHNLILDALRYWVREYHVDGFHILGPDLPMTSIVQDAVLSRTKIFADDFHGIQSNRKYKNLYIYKEEYQYPARQLLNHYDGDIREFVNQQKKQSEHYGYVNFLATNNGFTLADVFMYNDKHNEENGENNCDGSDYNLTNNYGVEGPTKKHYIWKLRNARIRTGLMMLMFAQGIPLIQAGDEFGNTQSGNNNAYCQDNEIGWVNWSQYARTAEEREWLKALIAFRKTHGLIAKDKPFRFNDYRSMGAPDLSYHGEHAWISQLDPGRKSLGMFYSGAYADGEDKSDIYIGYNFYSEEVKLALPKITSDRKAKKNWCLLMDSAREQVVLDKEEVIKEQQYVTLAPNSVVLLTVR